MEYQSCLLTISYNVRLYRQRNGISQEAMAKEAGLSPRLFQSLEYGTGNPTVSSLYGVARVMGINLSDLMHLGLIQIDCDPDEFLAILKKAFSKSRCAFGARNFEGVILWGNDAAAAPLGKSRGAFEKPFDLMTELPPSGREILRAQLEGERRGIAKPYTNTFPVGAGELLARRYYPTLVYLSDAKTCAYSLVYMIDSRDDCEERYYEYCALLFECLKNQSKNTDPLPLPR
jgi:transcriptional regulator with XRE-family HTH domain